jgi:O-antigen/teichoic acid export membrane protein
MPLLLRSLGSAQFGIWGAAASLAWLSTLADVGTGAALVTLIARAVAASDLDSARRYVSGTLGLGSCLAGIVALAVLAAWMAGALGTHAGPYLIALLGLALNIPLNAANNVWMALQEGYFASLWESAQTLLTLVGLVAAVMGSAGLMVCIAVVYGGLVLANLGSLMHLLSAHPELRPHGLRVPVADMRAVGGEGMMYFMLTLAGSLSFLLDNVLTLSWLGPEASARMTIALRICVMGMGAMGVILQPLWPAFAEAAESGDRKWIGKVLRRGSVWMIGNAIIGSALLVACGEPLLHYWLRDSLSIGQPLLWAIAAWLAAQALIRVPCLLLNGLSIIRYQVFVSVVATAIALGLKFILSREFGIAGILWATTAPYIIWVLPAVCWRVSRWAWEWNSVASASKSTSSVV